MNKGGFSWKRLIGITRVKQNFARKTGIPTSKSGLERKIGGMILGKGCLIILFGAIVLGSLINLI
ncbi:MAG TPA: hypothetical protein PL041_11100 [Melioribacteraceae bacterium]|nr:hypothetical protein [Melioribacteraceae bacterium]